MDPVDISLIVLTRDHEAFLANLLDSISDQFPAYVELVVVDVGSIDGTLHLLEIAFENITRRTTIIGADRQLTTLEALAKAAHLIVSEYVVMISGDDFFAPGYFEVLKRVLAEQPGPSVLNFSLELVDATLVPLGRRVPSWKPGRKRQRKQLFRGNPGTAPGAVLPLSLLKELQDWERVPPTLIEDYWLWWSLVEKANFINVPEASVYYRRHGSNLSSATSDKKYVWSLGYSVGEAYSHADSAIERIQTIWLLIRWMRRISPKRYRVYLGAYLCKIKR